MTEEIKPCPFCGGAGDLCQNRESRFSWFVAFRHTDLCPMVHTVDPEKQSFKYAELAASAWNKRWVGNIRTTDATKGVVTIDTLVERVTKAIFDSLRDTGSIRPAARAAIAVMKGAA